MNFDFNNLDKYKPQLMQLGTDLSSVGQIGTAAAYAGDSGPNVLGATLAGGLSGAAAGPLGILAGLGFGFFGAAKQKSEYEQRQEASQRQYVADRTVGPSIGFYNYGGGVLDFTDSGLLEIQTEIGEVMALPDLSIVTVKSTKKHEDLGKDVVTDLVPQGTYVFSNDKKLMLKKKSIKDKDNLLGINPVYYEEDSEDPNCEIQEVLFTDIMSDEEMTPADYIRSLQKKFKVSSREKDVFVEATNAENKNSRVPYIEKLIEFSEKKNGTKSNKPLTFKRGGYVGNSPKKYILGGQPNDGYSHYKLPSSWRPQAIDSSSYDNFNATSLAANQSMFDAFGSELDRFGALNDASYNNRQQEYEHLFKNQNRNNGLSMLGNLSATALQSSTQTPAYQSAAFANQMFQEIPRSMVDRSLGRIDSGVNNLARQLLESGVNPSQLPSLLSGSLDKASQAKSDLQNKYNQDRVETRRKYYAYLNQNLNKNMAEDVSAQNAERTANNQKIGLMGKSLQDFLKNNTGIAANRVETQNANTRNYNDNQLNLMRSRFDVGSKFQGYNQMNGMNTLLMRGYLGNTGANKSQQPAQVFPPYWNNYYGNPSQSGYGVPGENIYNDVPYDFFGDHSGIENIG